MAQNSTTGTKTLAAIVGPGDIGTDLLSKLRRSNTSSDQSDRTAARRTRPADQAFSVEPQLRFNKLYGCAFTGFSGA